MMAKQSFKLKSIVPLPLRFSINEIEYFSVILSTHSFKYSDMPTEMGSEAVEIITMATDKFHAAKNYEVHIYDEFIHQLLEYIMFIIKCVLNPCFSLLVQKGAAQLIKHTMDKKFGSTWHCIIGEGYGFDISCERRYLLHVYYGTIGILCYKC